MIHDSSLLTELQQLIKEMDSKNTDLVISVFGNERTGKSTFAVNLAKALDPTFNAATLKKRTALTFEDFTKIGPNASPYQVVWWDEAGSFSKRDSYGGLNRALLEYFQQAGGSKRIYILCFPELSEIDRKVVQRTRLFFETVRNRGHYWVKGWRADQIGCKIRELRLFAKKSRAAAWAGVPRHAIKTFKCDYTGIEPEISVYHDLKKLNLLRTDEKLRSHYAVNLSEIVVLAGFEIAKNTGIDYGRRQLYNFVKESLDAELKAGGVSENAMLKGPRDIMIRDEALTDKIISNIMKKFNTPNSANGAGDSALPPVE